jgi:hypothetical protein
MYRRVRPLVYTLLLFDLMSSNRHWIPYSIPLIYVYLSRPLLGLFMYLYPW